MAEEWERYRAAKAAEYMRHVEALSRRVRSLRMEIELQRQSMLPKAVCYEAAGASPNYCADAIPEGVAKLERLIADYCEELSACVEEQRRAHECVALIAREERRDALRLRYLCGMTWERVCVETGYSYRHVMRIKSEALSELYGVMPHEWRDPSSGAIGA